MRRIAGYTGANKKAPAKGPRLCMVIFWLCFYDFAIVVFFVVDFYIQRAVVVKILANFSIDAKVLKSFFDCVAFAKRIYSCHVF